MIWGEPVPHCRGLPRWRSGKEAACQCRRHKMSGFDPWVEKIPWNRKWHATPVFSLENSMEREAWWATVHGVTKSQTLLSMHAHTHTHTRYLQQSFPILQVRIPWGSYLKKKEEEEEEETLMSGSFPRHSDLIVLGYNPSTGSFKS